MVGVLEGLSSAESSTDDVHDAAEPLIAEIVTEHDGYLGEPDVIGCPLKCAESPCG
jgi:hypothetical protein